MRIACGAAAFLLLFTPGCARRTPSPEGAQAGTTAADVVEPTAPAGRRFSALAFDRARAESILFGGEDAAGNRKGDTWAWDGRAWEARRGSAAPAARSGHAMAYDGRRDRVVLFGGQLSDGTLAADTWEWNGHAWRELPIQGPKARHCARMAFDERRGVLVLSGGATNKGGVASRETWELDGVTWRQVDAQGPAGACHHTLAYDVRREQVVAFGGQANGDTLWAWDGGRWSRVDVPRPRPAPRALHAAAYDSRRERLVLYGGAAGTKKLFADTWSWDGERWVKAQAGAEGPGARTGAPVMAFDAARGRVVLFGGGSTEDPAPSDVWELDGTRWVQAAAP